MRREGGLRGNGSPGEICCRESYPYVMAGEKKGSRKEADFGVVGEKNVERGKGRGRG